MGKPKFDPNQPFEVVSKPKFDPSQPFDTVDESQLEAPDKSTSSEAAVRAFTNLFGFQPKIAGGLEALGTAVGIKGLGGQFKDMSQSSEGPTLDIDTLLKSYEDRKASEKALNEQAQSEHPVISTGAQLVQGLMLPGPAITSLGKAVGTGAGYGALQALGDSDLAKPLETAENVVVSGVTGGLLGGVLTKAPAVIKSALKNPIRAGAAIGGVYGAGKEALEGGDLGDIASAGVEGAATGAGIAAVGKGGLYLGKNAVSFAGNLPMMRTLKDTFNQASKGKTFSTKEGQDEAIAAVRAASNELPDTLSSAKQRLLDLEQKIIDKKSKPQDALDIVNDIMSTVEKETLAEASDRKVIQKAIDPFINKEAIPEAQIQEATNNVYNNFKELSNKFNKTIQNSAQKMENVVNDLDNSVGAYKIDDAVIRMLDPVKAKNIGEQSQVDLVRRNVAAALNLDPNNIKEVYALKNLKPSEIRKVIISLNSIKANLTDTARKFANDTVKTLEEKLLSGADDAAKGIYKQASKELATIGTLQDLTDIASRYQPGMPSTQGKDFSTAARDILKMQSPKNVEGVNFNNVLNESKELHPELVDYIKKDIIGSLKTQEQLSDPANILISKLQTKTPEEIILMRKTLENTDPQSLAGKKLKSDTLKKLNEKLLIGLKGRERSALAKISEQKSLIDQAAELSGTKLNEVGQLSEPDRIASMLKVEGLSAENKGIKKVNPALENAMSILSKLNKPKAESIAKNLEEAQIGQRLAKIHAEVPATPIGQAAKAMGTGAMKVVEAAGTAKKTSMDWIKDASTNDDVINNTINHIKGTKLMQSKTGQDMINKLMAVAKTSGQNRKALLFTLSQRPEYRNIINEITGNGEGK